MAGLEAVDDASRIDAQMERCLELENMAADQRNELRELQSRSIEDFEVSLRNEQKFLLKEKELLGAKVAAKKKIVEHERKVVASGLSYNEDMERMEVETLISYLKEISTRTPIFRDAVSIYSRENLTKEIDRIRLDGRRVKEEIEDLNSKYDLDVTGSVGILGKKSEIEELRDTQANLIESKSEILWCKKSNQFLNNKLKKATARKKREIASFQFTK